MEARSIVETLESAPEPSTEEIPQHQRLIRDIIGKAKPRKPLSFALGDAQYGESLALIITEDENIWLNRSAKLLGHAHR